ncbi:Pentachlorophenol 4-monooxygenase [Mycena sanguinolenta]|uniref:Pentachlorophenol 4-monooxygenase n=1 Tax=Mycena sanguinolenta TaxID=230812 RepID=A0A8H7DEX8_9AGAR|nr:Pentachlorophenol 4-monooxygenase [Mycena sanguinolenta]
MNSDNTRKILIASWRGAIRSCSRACALPERSRCKNHRKVANTVQRFAWSWHYGWFSICTGLSVLHSSLCMQPRTQELFWALDVLDEVEKQAATLPPARMYALPEGIVPSKTFNMAPTLDPTPACPLLNIMTCDQNNQEAILRTALQKYSCNVEFGTQLATFTHDAHGVDATIIDQNGQEETKRYDFLIGADGARGVVRKTLSFNFIGESRPSVKIIIADIVVEGIDEDHWHMFGEASADSVFLRPTGTPGLFALSLTKCGPEVDYDRLMKDRHFLQEAIVAITGRTAIKVTEVVWISRWSPNIRMVDKFSDGRCFLVGDAAHTHSITGGQGLNSSVQDSFNLAWKLALVLKGLAPMTLLDSYNDERVPVITEMINKTTALLNKTIGASAVAGDTARWNRGGPLLMLGVNYRWSSIVVDEQADDVAANAPKDPYGSQNHGLKAGDRAPDAPELRDIHGGRSSVHLFDVFDASRHTVLAFSALPEPWDSILAVLSQYPQAPVRSVAIVPSGVTSADIRGPDIFEDTQGHAYSNYCFEGGCNVAVVRPDGVLGAVVRTPEALERYFGRIFA